MLWWWDGYSDAHISVRCWLSKQPTSVLWLWAAEYTQSQSSVDRCPWTRLPVCLCLSTCYSVLGGLSPNVSQLLREREREREREGGGCQFRCRHFLKLAVYQFSSYLVRAYGTSGRLACRSRTWNAVDDTPPPSGCQQAAAAGAAPTDRNAGVGGCEWRLRQKHRLTVSWSRHRRGYTSSPACCHTDNETVSRYRELTVLSRHKCPE